MVYLDFAIRREKLSLDCSLVVFIQCHSKVCEKVSRLQQSGLFLGYSKVWAVVSGL